MGPGRTRPRRAVSVPCGGLLVIGRMWLVWSGIGIAADNHDRKWLTDLNAGRESGRECACLRLDFHYQMRHKSAQMISALWK